MAAGGDIGETLRTIGELRTFFARNPDLVTAPVSKAVVLWLDRLSNEQEISKRKADSGVMVAKLLRMGMSLSRETVYSKLHDICLGGFRVGSGRFACTLLLDVIRSIDYEGSGLDSADILGPCEQVYNNPQTQMDEQRTACMSAWTRMYRQLSNKIHRLEQLLVANMGKTDAAFRDDIAGRTSFTTRVFGRESQNALAIADAVNVENILFSFDMAEEDLEMFGEVIRTMRHAQVEIAGLKSAMEDSAAVFSELSDRFDLVRGDTTLLSMTVDQLRSELADRPGALSELKGEILSLRNRIEADGERTGESERRATELRSRIDRLPEEQQAQLQRFMTGPLAELRGEIQAVVSDRTAAMQSMLEMKEAQQRFLAQQDAHVAALKDFALQAVQKIDTKVERQLAGIQSEMEATRSALTSQPVPPQLLDRLSILESQQTEALLRFADKNAFASFEGKLAALKAEFERKRSDETAVRELALARIAELESKQREHDQLASRMAALEGRMSDYDEKARRVRELEERIRELESETAAQASAVPGADPLRARQLHLVERAFKLRLLMLTCSALLVLWVLVDVSMIKLVLPVYPQ